MMITPHPKTSLSLRAQRLIAVALTLVIGALSLHGCAQDVGLIDRSQPGLLKKSVFTGEWFMRRTVIDAPYDTGFTFIGEQDEVSRIRWEVQESHLIAWRVLPHVDNTPDAAPMAVFAIKGHVDLMRDYNPSTGEQTNVLTENTSDRVWYERDYIRVDWSQNLVTNFHFWVEGLDQDPVAYFIEDPSDPDSLLLGVKDGDGWLDYTDMAGMREVDEAHYLDMVTRVFVKPEEIGWEDWYGDIYYEPACWWYGNYDCAPAVISVRSAFLRADAVDTGYEPLSYPDNAVARDAKGEPIRVRWDENGNRTPVDDGDTAGGPDNADDDQGQPSDISSDPYATQDSSLVRLPMFDKFGYFRTERYGYDPLYGEVQSERTYHINRFNIWEQSVDDAGNPIPYAQRTPKPIVYYLSPEFPESMLGVAAQVADQWDAAFRETVSTLTGKAAPRMFELRVNSQTRDPETGAVTYRGEANGDLRYSHLWWVEQPTRAGLLGYGPSAADPTTGQIFAADAYVYGASVIEYATSGRDIVELLNGRLDPEEFALGENIKQYLHDLKAGGSQSSRRSIDELKAFAEDHQGSGPPSHDKHQKRSERPPGHHHHAHKPGIERFKRPAGWSSAQLARVQHTQYEDLLMSDPHIIAMKGVGKMGPDTPLVSMPPSLQTRVSPVWWSSKEYKARSLDRMRRFAKRNMLMATFYDDAIAGLALALKDESPESIHQTIAQAVFRATAEHEVGHTLGLRHNFEASTDALNYHPEYWALRGDNPQPLSALTQPEIDGRVREYQYSSIMDYASRFNLDTAGLGSYDVAAIKFGYGQLVEVFDQAPDEPLLELEAYSDGSYDRPFTFDRVLRDFRHYTKIPQMFGGTAGINARSTVPYTPEVAQLMGRESSYADQMTGDAPWSSWEVPYRFCSDEYSEGTPTCAAFDAGADAAEIVGDLIDRYRNYYWFNNFQRDRIFFDEWDYQMRIYWTYFFPIKTQFDHWVFGQWYDADTWEWMRDDAVAYEIEDVPWAQAIDGGLSGTSAVRDGMAFFQEVLAIPEPGAYTRDFSEGYWWAFDKNPQELCGDTWGWDLDYWCADANIGLGTGRYLESIYDVETGYYFYDKLKWVGSFYDKITAIEVLSSPDTYFLGVDTSSSLDQWAISFYSSFKPEMQRLFSGILSDDFSLFGGTIDDAGNYVPPDPFATEEEQALAASRGAIDPSTSFSVQLYALWYGMAYLNANYDNTFNDSAKIWLEGSGEAITPADPALLVSFTDPFNNRTYQATQLGDPNLVSVGASMLTRANLYLADYNAAVADGDTDLDYYKWRVTNIVENIEVVRGLYDLYGYLIF